MQKRPLARVFLAALFLPALFLPAADVAAAGQDTAPTSARHWLGSDGQPLPFETEEQVLDFLREARAVSQKELTSGSNRPLKVLLEHDGVQANAIFRIVDVKRKRAKLDGKLVVDFHDSYVYECAAYEVSRLLGIDNVPPCVNRRVQLTEGTMQLWVEGARTEKDRRDAGESPPQPLQWLRQKQTMILFDALISNFDRNQGNMLIDPQWGLWFIDHTRSFKKSAAVDSRLERIIWCERGVWEKLQALEKKQLSQQLRSRVSPVRVNLMLKRRDKLVAYLRDRIEEMGEGAVLFDASQPADSALAGMSELALDDEMPETSSMLEDPR